MCRAREVWAVGQNKQPSSPATTVEDNFRAGAAALKPDFRFVFPIVAFFKHYLIRVALPFVLERDIQMEENLV